VYLDHDQRWTASGGASYRIGETLVSTDLIVGSGLRKGFANTEALSPYWAMNAGLKHEFDVSGVGHMTARLDVVNLLDRRYELRDGSGIGVGAPQWGQRRTILAGLSKSF
jgi:outer membrane receptor protein involved in Fe transport